MYKEDLALNNLEWLIYYKIQQNQTKLFIFNIYMYKEDLALNNLEWLIYYKTQHNQTKLFIFNIYIYEEDLALNNLEWLIYYKTQHNQTKPYQKPKWVSQRVIVSFFKNWILFWTHLVYIRRLFFFFKVQWNSSLSTWDPFFSIREMF